MTRCPHLGQQVVSQSGSLVAPGVGQCGKLRPFAQRSNRDDVASQMLVPLERDLGDVRLMLSTCRKENAMRRTFLGLAILTCLVATASAQQRTDQKERDQPRATQTDSNRATDPNRAGQRDQPRPGATTETGRAAATTEAGGAASNSADQQIAAFLHGSSSNEIEIAKFAQQKLQAEEAKQFAAKMIREHQPGCDAMKRLAGNLASHEGGTTTERAQPAGASPRREGAASAPTEQRPGAPTGTQPRDDQPRVIARSTAIAGHAGGLDWVSVHKELGAQCLESTKKELGAKPSGEFDKCFMGQQIMAHMKAVDELEVLRNYASGELRQKIDEELKMAKGHFEEAKQIMEKLEGQPAERVSRNPKQ
jgi:predicted outer membrane protein